MEAADFWKKIKEKLEPLDKEVFVGYDSNGKKIGFGNGGEESVGIPETLLKELKGGIVFHNHPSGGPLSAEDLMVAAENEIPEVAVITSGGKTYHIIINDFEKIKSLAKELESRYPVYRQRNEDLVEELVKHGKIKKEDSYKEFLSITFKDFEKFYKSNEEKYDYKFIMYK